MTRRLAARVAQAAMALSLLASGPLAAADEASEIARREAERMATPWSFTALYGHGWLTDGRPDRNDLDVQLYRRVTPELVVGGHVAGQRRPPDTDTTYGATFFWSPLKTLEWHGWLDYSPDPAFRPERAYSTGLEWRVIPQLSLLVDLKREEFTDGRVDQVIPGLTYWFSDETWLTVRYASGRAYGERDFDSYSAAFNAGTPGGGRLTLAYSHGTDPDKDPAVPGVILTDANTYVVFYRHPLRRDLDLVVGVEIEDRKDLYTRTTGTLGMTYRF